MKDSRKASQTRRRPFRLTPLAPRLLTGAIAAAAALSAGYLLFAPFSDLSALQLAAGARADRLGESQRTVLFAPTGRGWGAAELARQEEAMRAATTTRVARGGHSSPLLR